MEQKQHNSNGGFLLGLIFGVVITLLFVTKKGRRILKMLLEEGKDKISGWDSVIEEFQKIVDDDDEVGDDFLSEEEHSHINTTQDLHKEVHEEAEANQEVDTNELKKLLASSEKPSPRRFFRRPQKRVN